MSKFRNYTSDIFKLEKEYSRYSVSRIVDSSLDDILEIEIPTDLPDKFFIEFNLYSYANNQLVFSTWQYSDEVQDTFKVTTLQYADQSIRRLLFVNLLNIIESFPDGRFEVVINLFASEFGGPQVKSLVLNTISPSRTEVELKLAPEHRTVHSASKLVEFSSPQISRDWVLNAVQYVCNQSQSFNPNIPTDTTPLTFDIIEEFLPEEIVAILNDPATDSQFTASVKTATQQILNKMYLFATKSLDELPASETRIIDTKLVTITSSSLSQVIKQNPINSNFTIR